MPAKKPIFMFGLKFGALAALLYILLAIPFFEDWLHSYLAANAWLANATLDLFGQDTHATGTLIESPQFSVNLKRGCDAVEPTWLFCAAVACFPATWRQKLAGMCAGAVLLQLLNFIRIVTPLFDRPPLTGLLRFRPLGHMAHHFYRCEHFALRLLEVVGLPSCLISSFIVFNRAP